MIFTATCLRGCVYTADGTIKLRHKQKKTRQMKPAEKEKEKINMKKMAMILAVLVMVFAAVTATAEENAFTFRNGVTFGMNMDQVIAAETVPYHEIDNEHTHGPVEFAELEYEDVAMENVGNAPADLKYLFVGNELVAIRVDFEERDITFDQVKADLTALCGEATAVDTAVLANGIYAVDDDGRLEGKAEAIVSGSLMIVIEQDEDDINVTFVDLNAAYVNVR